MDKLNGEGLLNHYHFWGKKTGRTIWEDGKWRWNEIPVSPNDEKIKINSKSLEQK